MGMQFVVPQFIEVESKVIGPISVRQFIILLSGAGLLYIEFELFSFWVFAVLGVFTTALVGTFAFAKVNSQPFHIFALSAIQTARRPKLSIWNRHASMHVVTKSARKDKSDKKSEPFVPKPEVSESHLAELSLIVDTGGRYTAQDIERLRKEQQAVAPDAPTEPVDSK